MKTSVQDTTDHTVRLLERAADAAREGSQMLRENALAASDRTVGYIREEPVKAVLLALAAGAGIAALAHFASRRG